MIMHQAILVFFLSSAYSANIGERPDEGQSTFIYNIIETPFIASISFVYDTFPVPDFPCSGSIIGDKFILTSARCMTSNMDSIVGVLPEVRVGTIKSRGGGNKYSVEKIIIHEKFNKYEPHNADIAILKLNESIVFNSEMKKLDLQHKNISKRLKPGMDVTVTGWGCSWDPSLGNRLRQVTVPIRKTDFCLEANEQENHKIICAGAATTCKGDLGGPLTYNDVQYGILASPETETMSGLTIYTRVSSYYNWIIKTMEIN